jgi:hypothetical protein
MIIVLDVSLILFIIGLASRKCRLVNYAGQWNEPNLSYSRFLTNIHADTMKNKKYHTVEIISKSNIKIDIPNTQIHDRLPSWLGTAGSSIRTVIYVIQSFCFIWTLRIYSIL